MKNERWARVPGYDHYEVSSNGRLRTWIFKNGAVFKRLKEPRILPGCVDKSRGYVKVALTTLDGICTQYALHRLVLLSFVGQCPPKHVAAHLDGTRVNNSLSNLQWVTQKENLSHCVLHGTRMFGDANHASKVSSSDVRQIRRLHKSGVPYRVLAIQFKIGKESIAKIVRRENWAHLK